MMTTRELTIRFVTPAFLGDAEQNGRWRTPPFKALLRRWWRVAWAAEHGSSQWKHMRVVEGHLFGHAWLDAKRQEDKVAARKSCVRMRIDSWSSGTMRAMPQTRPAGEGRKTVASALYLGYGPVKAGTELKMQHPVDADDTAQLSLAFPEAVEGTELLDTALALAHGFGAVGSRSSNGWGSVSLEMQGGALPDSAIHLFVHDWEHCLHEEWPHAIGADGRPLMWTTKEARIDWKSVIEDLAEVRKKVNSAAGGTQERLILNQPVAGKGDRMPSQLRFKVQRTAAGKLQGLIYHVPHTPPPLKHFDPNLIQRVWASAHELLDHELDLPRIEV